MIKYMYVLSEKNVYTDEDYKIAGIVTDYKVASAFLNLPRDKTIIRRWQIASVNNPELLNRIAKGGEHVCQKK